MTQEKWHRDAPHNCTRRQFSRLAVSTMVSTSLGCAGASKPKTKAIGVAPPPELPEYTGPLVAPEAIPWEFMWQQRVSATHGENQGAFDAIVQKQGAELLVLGLTPFGTRAFSLKQRGLSFEYKQFVPFDLPFSPEAVLFDIHRCFFYKLVEGAPEGGPRTSRWKEETITDTFDGKRLLSRQFNNVARSGGRITIDYGPKGYSPGTPPLLTILKNEVYGYVLRVETSSAQML